MLCRVLKILYSDNDQELAALILDEKVNQIVIGNYDYVVPLIYELANLQDLVCLTGAVKCFDILENLGYDFSQQNTKGLSPIHYACISGSLEIIRKLEVLSSIYELVDSHRLTPIHYAALFGNLSVFQHLFAKGMSLGYKTNCYEYPVHYAVKNGFIDVVKFIFEGTTFKSNIDSNIISKIKEVAIKYGHVDIIDYLYKAKIIQFDAMIIEDAARCSSKQMFDYLMQLICVGLPQPGKILIDVHQLKSVAVRCQSTYLLEYILSLKPKVYFDKEVFNLRMFIKNHKFTKLLAMHFPVEFFKTNIDGLGAADLIEIFDEIENKNDRRKILDSFVGRRTSLVEKDFLEGCIKKGGEISIKAFKKILRSGWNIEIFEPVFNRMMKPSYLSSLNSLYSINFVLEHMEISGEEFKQYEIFEKIINSSDEFMSKRKLIIKVIRKYRPDMISMIGKESIKNEDHLLFAIIVDNPNNMNQRVLELTKKVESKSEHNRNILNILKRNFVNLTKSIAVNMQLWSM